ncbi:MAG TPA: molybdopterin-dependent oxidoreductase [Acidobacteriaceae bacterium]|jgi:anaerobic selenocysteine-containing dehydrogenase
MRSSESPLRVVHAVCSHDCPDSCAVLVSVDAEGRAQKIAGDPAHPVTRGFLCGKVARYLDRVYSPDRLLYPMRRRAGAAKGPLPTAHEAESFERISWDEALDTIAQRLAAIAEQHGPESVLPYSYAGTIGVLGYGSMDRRFFHRFGASQLDRTICATAGGDAILSVYGRKLGTDTEHFHRARLVLAWGANIHGTSVHLWPQIEEARRAGARLIVIDPYQTRTAKLADWHIAIHPGTDAALALGMMHVIFAEGLEDRAYIEQHTVGAKELAERAQEYPPERVAAWTGMTAEEIRALAREYATTQPAVIRLNYGIQRSENGGTAARAVCMLPLLTGAWKRLGGGLQLSTSGAFRFNSQTLERPDLMYASPLGRAARVVNMSRLGHALTELSDPPVKALFVYNSNPAAIAPNQNTVLRGMARPDLFTVVHEQFWTDTADYADIVLPATTFLEHADIQGAYGHYHVQLSDQAIAPVGEALPNIWLFGQLGQRIGFPEACFRDTEQEMLAQALSDEKLETHPQMDGITLDQLRREHSMRLRWPGEPEKPFQPFANGGFGTPSGKGEFYSAALAEQGLDPLPAFKPPKESRHSENRAYPLEFLGRKADNYMNSTFANHATHQKMEAAHTGRLEIHPDDATPRGIHEGDAVEIFNDRGRIRLVAQIHTGVPAGVVASRLNWNKLSAGGSNVNALTSERLTDIGRGPTFYSTLVQVARVESLQHG